MKGLMMDTPLMIAVRNFFVVFALLFFDFFLNCCTPYSFFLFLSLFFYF